MTKLYTYLFVLLFPLVSRAQIIWDFSSASPSSGIPANITVPAITLGNNNGTSTFSMITSSSASSGYTGATGGGNAGAAVRTGAFASATSAYFEITLTPATGASISVSEIDFGTRSTSTGPQAYDIRSSLDNFGAAVSGTLTNNGTWVLKTNAVSLAGAADQAITVRIYGYNGTGSASSNTANWRIDDLAITATATGGGGGTPTGTITVSPSSLTGFNTTAGTASAAQSISVSGSNLTDNIVIAAPAGYEVSTSTADNSYASTLALTESGGTVAATTVNVRIAATAAAGSTGGSLSLSSTGAGSQSVTLTGTVNAATPDPNANIVINQIYGGGGNTGATYKNDFVELYNNESRTVNLAGWSVQYSSATDSSWARNLTQLSGIIPAHGFFLIQLSAGAGGTVNLPAPDLAPTGSQALALSATNGKLILCNVTTAQTGANPSGTGVIDKVGYGTANGYEGSPTPATSNTTAIRRNVDGLNTGNNAADFFVTAPLPRNSAYTTTAPKVFALSPITGARNMQPTIPLSITFDKPVVKGSSGQITVIENGTPTAIDINSSDITITNNATVNINTPLAAGDSYSIEISAGAFQDLYGNNFAGLLSATDWTFTIYSSAVAATLPVTFDFQACTGSGLLPDGFTQYSIAGVQVWDCTAYGRDPSAPAGQDPYPNGIQMNGYANGINNYNVDWLISPKLDLSATTYPLLSFWSRNAYAGDPLQLKISTDYSGTGDPTLAHWTDLNGKFPSSGSDTWTPSVNINLSHYKQTAVYLAFVYTSTTDDGSRWTLDDINLINSSTPPPPSLTLSASDLEFGYAAAGAPVTKKLIVTGNDLVSDLTLSTTGKFLLSTDSINFGTTATLGHDTASDVPEPIYVRFDPAISNSLFSDSITVQTSDTTAIVYLKGNSIDPASTLSIVDWNLNWFCTPDPTLGPTNKALQKQNVGIILPSLHADLYALQEVVNEDSLKAIVATMPGYAYIINNYGSYSSTAIADPDPLNTVQKLAFVYNTTKITPVRTDSLLSIGVNTAADTATKYYNDWASGRFPYMLTADVLLSDNNGGTITKRMRFIDVHAKANTAPVATAYARRLDGANALDSLIKASYANDNVIILGDFNDDLNQTITTGIQGDTTSWKAFIFQDSALYIFPTKSLSLSGQHSDVSYSSVIDNVIATKPLANFYLPSSATVLSEVSSLVSSYGTTTTDHYPVFSQFSFVPPVALPVTLLNFTAVRQDNAVLLNWSTAEETNSKTFEVERGGDGAHFTQIGKVAARGNSEVVSSYAYPDEQPLPGNNYYRLRQVDLDGHAVYSKVLKVNIPVKLEVRPNPAHGAVTIYLDNAGDAANIMILDLSGKLLLQKTVTAGTGVLPLEISGLARGIYTVKAVSSAGVTTQKLLVD